MEWFDVCNEEGCLTGEKVERKRAHAEGICHRTVHIWVVRFREGRPEILLQKRAADKDSFPGRFDTSSSGHIQAGDEPDFSACRELEEELGIMAAEEELTFIQTFRIKYEKEFHGSLFKDNEIAFLYLYEKPVEEAGLILQAEEVECVRWFDLEEVYAAVSVHDQTFCVPSESLHILREYLKKRE